MTDQLMRYASQLEFDKIVEAVSKHAVSEETKRRALEICPSSDCVVVENQLSLCDDLYTLLQRSRKPSFFSVSGIGEIALRAKKGGILSMKELLFVGVMLKNAAALLAWHREAPDSASTQELFFYLYEDQQLQRRIESAILSDTEMSDSASRTLADIRRRIVQSEESIRRKLQDVIKGEGTKKLLQDAVVTMRSGRYVVPVKAENRVLVKGLVHDVSQSGSTFFVEPEAVVEANNRIMVLKGEEAAEIERILQAFSAEVQEIADRMAESYRAFIEIDLLMAKAQYALETAAVRPRINDKGQIRLVSARHPLIPRRVVVPIDLSLGDACTQMVITGPNTGGKTVTLKTVGLLSLMAMSGIFVPASEGTELSVFDAVYADIGDEQSIEQNLSTFSAHMTNIAWIVKHANSHSLVLLDELGAGTDPTEGAAIAVAILEHLHALQSRVIATTHYGELKLYAMQTEGVQNASCAFDVETLRPTYHLLVGVPGRSNALVIAKRLGLPADLIDAAKQWMDPEKRRFEDVLSEIEKLKSDAAESVRQADERLRGAAEQEADAKAKSEQMELQAQLRYREAEKRSKQMAADVEAAAAKLLSELRELDNEKGADRKKVQARAREIARRDAAKLLLDAPKEESIDLSDQTPLQTVQVGQHVLIGSIGQVGEVLSSPDQDNTVTVQAGILKTRVAVEDLYETKRKKPQTRKPQATTRQRPMVSTGADRDSGNELNLIGQKVGDALPRMETFIDGALLRNISTIYLIHGKGTGALRSALHDRLREMSHVRSFRLGAYGEGDSGVTVVELT